MLKKERQAIILHQVNLHNKVSSANLSKDMHVSEDTIRRDLQQLADEGKLIKVHGGALSHAFSQVQFPIVTPYPPNHKNAIAHKAASLIQDGMFVLTAGGHAIIEMAKALPSRLRATFVSGSIPAILEYMQHPTVEVIAIGDKVSKNARITTGGEAITQIKRIRADVCILGVNALSLKDGITDSDWEVVQLKKAMIESSLKIVCLCMSEKLNSLLPIHVCELNRIHTLITERHPDDPVLKPYRDAGIEIL
jgi:DeoR/GlpR family transcriptional regulator of sugar metabolism